MDKNFAWLCKDFIIAQHTFSLCNTETAPKSSLSRPGKSFMESSDKFKKRKVAELESMASSSNELLLQINNKEVDYTKTIRKKKIQDKKASVQKKFWDEVGLLIDFPRSCGSGSSNNGSTARLFFQREDC